MKENVKISKNTQLKAKLPRKTSFLVVKDNLQDYLDVYIQILCSLVTDAYKLTDKERQFLVLTILYQYEGGNLLDFPDYSEYMLSKRCCSKASHVSIYKQKLSTKKWVKSNKHKFEILNGLDFKPGEEIFSRFELKLKE